MTLIYHNFLDKDSGNGQLRNMIPGVHEFGLPGYSHVGFTKYCFQREAGL